MVKNNIKEIRILNLWKGNSLHETVLTGLKISQINYIFWKFYVTLEHELGFKDLMDGYFGVTHCEKSSLDYLENKNYTYKVV